MSTEDFAHLLHLTAHDWRTALDSALGRAARVLMRLWRRARSKQAPLLDHRG